MRGHHESHAFTVLTGGQVVPFRSVLHVAHCFNASLSIRLLMCALCLQGEGKSFRILMALVAALKKHGESAGVAKGADSALTVTGIGMWVRRDRRRRGIAEAIIRGVVESCRGKGVPHFSAFYSGTGSQRAAAKAGLQVGVV